MDSGYRQQPIGNGRVRFTVQAAAAPRPRLAPALAALVAAALVGVATFRFGTAGLALGLRAGAAAVAAVCVHATVRRALAHRLERARSPGGIFVVGPGGIEHAHGPLARGEVRRLAVHALPGRARAVSFSLCAGGARGTTTLAGGMEEATALGLLADVSRILRVEGASRAEASIARPVPVGSFAMTPRGDDRVSILVALVLGTIALAAGCAPSDRAPGGSGRSGVTSATPWSLTDPKTPDELVRAYYAAIDRGDYRAAYSAWGRGGEASGQTYEQFAAGFEDTKAVAMEVVGPVSIEGAAGSSYATVPVVVRADEKGGVRRNFEGRYVVRRANDVPGATPEQLRWHIDSAEIRELR